MRFQPVFSFKHPASSPDRRRGECGTTFVEMLVVLAIISLLAVVTLPYVEKTVQRRNEIELRRVLREVRTAIDEFHEDWEAQKIPQGRAVASENGYPVDFEVLVNGIEGVGADANFLRYLRAFPKNPFSSGDAPFEEQWLVLGYRDQPDANGWNGEDVYDLRAITERVALNGTTISDW